MGRYYVVLPGQGTSDPYVIAEVVREPLDDGAHRELSLAGNLAGFSAEILTKEELLAAKGGFGALERWRAGNDNSFVLDTLWQGIGLPDPPPRVDDQPRKSIDREELRVLIDKSAKRAGEIAVEVERLRVQSESSRRQMHDRMYELRANLKVKSSLLEDINRQLNRTPKPKPRHLRSVS